ncbi:MAG: aspartate-semialdehyde dehydrogenase [Candidatus Schmidhempelia sp.]|nr:aspartate-semialdehyde dehydrogenase [Candidatus Schmidhempelia sp.]
MAAWNIAVVGATGAVGSNIIELLEERQFPVSELFAFATEDHFGEAIRFNGKSIKIQTLADFDWSRVNIAFFTAGADVAELYAYQAADMGCIVIDTSDYFTRSPDVPLIVPNVNDKDLIDYRNGNIIAIANGIVSQLLRTVTAITDRENVIQLHVNSYLPASFYGKKSIDSLAGQSARLLNGLAIEEKQLAFNLQPVVDKVTLLSEEALLQQCRRVIGNHQLPISFDFIDVPVFYGLSQSINLTLHYPIDLEQLPRDLAQLPDIELSAIDVPTPVQRQDTSLKLKIGNLRYAYGVPELLQLWAVSDNVRYLGGLMAIETAERLIEDYL